MIRPIRPQNTRRNRGAACDIRTWARTFLFDTHLFYNRKSALGHRECSKLHYVCKVTNKIRSIHGTIVARLQLYASPKDALRLQEKNSKSHYGTTIHCEPEYALRLRKKNCSCTRLVQRPKRDHMERQVTVASTKTSHAFQEFCGILHDGTFGSGTHR